MKFTPFLAPDSPELLIIRASEGTLRAVKNLCIGSLIESVRDQKKTVDLRQVNAVLMQPHWRHNSQNEPSQPLVHSNQAPNKPNRYPPI